MFDKIIFVLSCVVLVQCSYEERMDELVNHLGRRMEEKNEPDFDVLSDEDSIAEIRRIIEDHGFDSNDLLSDISFLYSIPGIFKSGDARRWTTLNFSYQLACYGGKTGSFLEQAWWVYNRFNGYGCYCGGGNYYGNYLDGLDYCCKVHDHCYDRVMAKYKLKLGCDTYSVPYSVSCCKDQKYTKCTDSGPSAGRELCECDQVMAKCAAQNARSYNKNFMNDRSRCRDPSGRHTKPLGLWDVVKSCKHAFSPDVTYPITYGSQGTCPKSSGSTGWFWG